MNRIDRDGRNAVVAGVFLCCRAVVPVALAYSFFVEHNVSSMTGAVKE